MEREVVIKNVVEACLSGKHGIVITGAQNTGKSCLANSIFKKIVNERSFMDMALLMDEVCTDLSVEQLLRLFKSTRDGICIITHHAADKESLKNALINSLLSTGWSLEDAKIAIDEFLSVYIHVAREGAEYIIDDISINKEVVHEY